MILEFIKNGPLFWPTVKENGVTRPKKYSELSATEAIQADCDVKATNIILQGLPPDVYALVSTHKDAKELWEIIQMLMQGTSLTKQERELNTKFLNTLPPEWSKFMTDVKLVRDLHTTNVDQLHAYLGQHKYHANENSILVLKPHNKTPYELLIGRSPNLHFMRLFGCLVTILNTLDHLGKFERKVDEGFLVGYFVNSKAFRSSDDKDTDEVPGKGDEGVCKGSRIDDQERTDSST
nr:retrovirus-related Pol polyprotein from transposon TNT 1-94 [Tanacetum cinerariifolium]